MNNKITFNYILILIILFGFFAGLYLNENSSGGGSIDFPKIYSNLELFYFNNLLNFPWSDYNSSSLPLFYIINSYVFLEPSKFNIVFLNLTLAFLCVFFQFLILKIKIKKIDKSYLLLLSFLILLSPYVRTSTFWGLEEVLGIFLLILCLYFLIKYENKKKFIYLFFIILFSSLAFYSRQSYLFIVLFSLLKIINFKEVFNKNNLIIIIIYIFFLTPSLFFFHKWGGLMPPIAVEMKRNVSFYLSNFPIILTIIFIYFIPFLYLSSYKIKDILNFFKKNLIIIILLNLLFYITLIIYEFKIQTIGYGFFIKILNLLHLNYYFELLLICILSSLSLILLLKFFNRNIITCLFLLIFIFLNINLIFQEYFDPLTFIIILSLYKFNNISIKKTQNFIILSFFYYTFFLLGANFYYILSL